MFLLLVQVLTFCCKAIPVFNNLIHLTIETDQDVDWESLPNLLKNCPNLETLVFEVPSQILLLHLFSNTLLSSEE